MLQFLTVTNGLCVQTSLSSALFQSACIHILCIQSLLTIVVYALNAVCGQVHKGETRQYDIWHSGDLFSSCCQALHFDWQFDFSARLLNNFYVCQAFLAFWDLLGLCMKVQSCMSRLLGSRLHSPLHWQLIIRYDACHVPSGLVLLDRRV